MHSTTPIIRVPSMSPRASAAALPRLLERVEFENRSAEAAGRTIHSHHAVARLSDPNAIDDGSIRLIRLRL